MQWVKVDNDVKDVLPDAFDAGKNKEIKQSKLRVTLVRAVSELSGVFTSSCNSAAQIGQTVHWSPLSAGQERICSLKYCAPCALRLALLSVAEIVGRTALAI